VDCHVKIAVTVALGVAIVGGAILLAPETGGLAALAF